MKTRHTPGPWSNVGLTVWSHIGGANRQIGEAQVDDGNGVYKTNSIDEAKANARLIAAAPELLEALIGLVDNAGLSALPGYESELWPAVAAARAAIAKAVSP